MPPVSLVSRTSPRNGSPLLHRTVTLANRVPRLELSGILTFGGVIVPSTFGAGLWRALVSQIRPAAPLCPAMASSGVVTDAGMAKRPGCPAPADVASNTPASPTSCFILRSSPQTGQFSTKASRGRLPNRRAVRPPLIPTFCGAAAGRRSPAARLAGGPGSVAAGAREGGGGAGAVAGPGGGPGGRGGPGGVRRGGRDGEANARAP